MKNKLADVGYESWAVAIDVSLFINFVVVFNTINFCFRQVPIQMAQLCPQVPTVILPGFFQLIKIRET
jgi:hypothetical protein